MLTAAYLDMLPWVVFAVMVRRGGLGPLNAAVGATAAGALLTVVARHRGRPAPVARIGLGCFALVLATMIAVPSLTPPEGSIRSATVLLLSLVMLASQRWAPLAAAYLADEVPPRLQRSAHYRATVRQVTGAWAVGGAIVGASFAMLAVDATPFASTFWGWLVPLLGATATVAWSLARCQALRASAMEPPGDPEAPPFSGLSDRPHGVPGLPQALTIEPWAADHEEGLAGRIGVRHQPVPEDDTEPDDGFANEGSGPRWMLFTAGARRARRRLTPGLTGHLGASRRDR